MSKEIPISDGVKMTTGYAHRIDRQAQEGGWAMEFREWPSQAQGTTKD